MKLPFIYFVFTPLVVILLGTSCFLTKEQTGTVYPTDLVDEYWQIQGTGDSYAEATTVVKDGSTLAYAFRYGEEAGDELAGTTRLYYNPQPNSNWSNGIRPATNHSTDTDVVSVSSFESAESGIKTVCDEMHRDECTESQAYYMTASQAVPLKDESTLRIFFEAQDMSVTGLTTTEIFSMDSQDGYVGEDFNTSFSTICGGAQSTDFAPGGDCELTKVVSANSESGLTQARQFKIGYPIQDSWLWDQSVGTFMVITGADQCRQTNDGLFYAVWDGANWDVLKDDQGCAQALVPYAHGPVIVHLGDGRYKMYYEDIMSNSPLVKVTKPLRFITADATRTGDPTVVDFADWDSSKEAGEVTFLWPDGSELTPEQESGLGDHFIYTPNGIESRVMYMNLGGLDNTSDPSPSNGIGIAVPVQR